MRYVDAVVNLKQPENTGGASFSGCHRVMVADLGPQKGKFVANYHFKKAEKIICCEI